MTRLFFKHKAQILGQQLRVILALNHFSFGPKDLKGQTEYKLSRWPALSREAPGSLVPSPCPSGHSALSGAVLSRHLTVCVRLHLVSLPQSPGALGLGCRHQMANGGPTDLSLHAVPTQEDRQWPRFLQQ